MAVSSAESPTAMPSSPLIPLDPVKATLRLPKPPPPPKPLYLTVRARRTNEGGAGGVAGRDGNRPSRTRGELPTWARTLRGPEGLVAGAPDSIREGEEDKPTIDRAGVAGAAVPVGSSAPVSALPESGIEHAADSASVDNRKRGEDADGSVASTPAAMREPSFASSSSSQLYSTPVGTLRLEETSDETKRYSTIRFRNEDGQLHIFFDPHLHNPFVPSPPSIGVEDKALTAKSKGGNVTEEELPGPSASSLSSAVEAVAPTAQELLPLPTQALPAVALHDFRGIAEHGELSFGPGEGLKIEVEDVGGGWSLGFTTADGEAGRGLIPRAWYAVSRAKNVADSDTRR